MFQSPQRQRSSRPPSVSGSEARGWSWAANTTAVVFAVVAVAFAATMFGMYVALDVPDAVTVTDADCGGAGGITIQVPVLGQSFTVCNETLGVKIGYTLIVDKVFGNDMFCRIATMSNETQIPCLTISRATVVAGAIATMSTPVIVRVLAGVYEETITVPPYVSVVAGSVLGVRIVQQNVVSDTTVVTLHDNSRLEGCTIELSSDANLNLTGVLFVHNAATSVPKIRNVLVEVDNSGADPTEFSHVHGILTAGTGSSSLGDDAVRASTIRVFGAGTGIARGIEVNNDVFGIRDTNVYVENIGGGNGTFIGVETLSSTAFAILASSRISGTTSDVSKTLGRIQLTGVDLATSTANGLSFEIGVVANTYIFGDNGAIPSVPRYLRPGQRGVTTAAVGIALVKTSAIAFSMHVKAVTAPGPGNTHRFTLRIDAVDTPLFVELGPTDRIGMSGDVSVTVQVNSTFSVFSTTSGATNVTDVVVGVAIL